MSDLEVYQPPPATQAVALLEIDSWTAVAGQVIRLAKEIYDTPFVPDGLRGSVPAVAAAILAGRELGLPPMTSLANVHVIKGKPALSAVLMRALIQSGGHQWEDVETTDTRAVIRARRRGEAEWTTVSFTADQARHAKIDLGGYPQDKLYARATSRLARRKFADVIAGMPYSAEELEDGEPDGVVLADDPGYKADRQAAAIEAPKAAPRTAQRRRTAANDATPASPAAPPATEAQKPAESLPPLPGEDDPTDEDTERAVAKTQERVNRMAADEALATTGQVGIIARHFQRLGFTDDERDQRLVVTAQIAARDVIGSTKELTQPQAKAVADTLSRCKDRDQLIALLVEQERENGE